jgi:opacity protein-like surface antigen
MTGGRAVECTSKIPRCHVGLRTKWGPQFLLFVCFILAVWARPSLATVGMSYLGVGAGNSSATVDKKSVQFHTVDWKPDVFAWRVFAGYRINRNVGIEGGYIPLGKARVSTMGGDYFEARVSGFEITPVGYLPIVKGLAAFARGGLFLWHSDISYRFSTLGSGAREESGSTFAVSGGAQYVIGRRVSVRAEYSLYDVDKTKAGAGDHRVILLSGGLAL